MVSVCAQGIVFISMEICCLFSLPKVILKPRNTWLIQNKGVKNKMTDEEKVAQIFCDGLQEVKNSIGKLDDTLRTKIFYELSETNNLLNQILDEFRKNRPRVEE